MKNSRLNSGMDRRHFLAAGGSGLLAAALPVGAGASGFVRDENTENVGRTIISDPAPARKIPIGVFDAVYDKLSLDAMLEKVSALGLEAMEIGTGGYPGNNHCPVDELLADAGKAKAWKKKFEDHGIRVATLSCHGNPVHPDAKHAAHDAGRFAKRFCSRSALT
jgi:hypothetical protein